MALGARPSQIRSEVLTLSLRLLAGGTVFGGIGAWLTGKAMQTVLFHVPALSMPALGTAVGILAAVSLVACLLPAQRAARISPMQALAEQ
jgi:ABC-type antimicrobial peptide transport system permease subunit